VFTGSATDGVKTTVLLAESKAIAPETGIAPIVSATLNVPGAEIVAGSIALLNVAAIF
jgi:hypothetical protein